MILRDIDFLYPIAIYAMSIIGALALLWLFFYFYRKRTLEKLIPKSFQIHLIRAQPSYLYWGQACLVTIIWILAVVALMGPYGLGDYAVEGELIQKNAKEVIFLLDVSSSMAVKDARYGKDRLESAKEIIDNLMAALPGETMSFDYFTSGVFQYVPATMDSLFLRLMNKHVKLNEGEIGGTDFVFVLQKLSEQLKKKPLGLMKTLIVLTDGGDAPYETLQGEEREKRKEEILKLAAELELLNVHLIIVGMGSLKGGTVPDVEDQGKPVTSVLQQTLLQEMATAAHGVYFASNEQPHADLEEKILPRITYSVPTIAASQGQSQTRLVPKLYFQIPLGIAILLLILVL